MRKAIFRRFMLILIMTVFFCIGIFSAVMGNMLRNNTEADMFYVLQMMDDSIDYTKELQEQVRTLPKTIGRKNARYTIIYQDGKVAADSEAFNLEDMKNHAEREEIMNVAEYGRGTASRKSETTGKKLLYVACLSKKSNYILRVAVPYQGMQESLYRLLPAALAALVVSGLLSFFLADNFSKKITNPLCEISGILRKFKEEEPELEFKEYAYEELNVIARTTKHMAETAKEHIKKQEFDRIVKQEFFSNASHELKTPITSIRGYAELLKAGFAKEEEKEEEFLERIVKETDHMTSLINDILTISRLEAEEAADVKTEIRMPLLLEDILSSYRPIAAEYNVNLLAECAPITVYADMRQLRQLVSNLVGNAVKYNRSGGFVKITIDKEQSDMKITVQDSGIGIPEDSVTRIFERFYRIDKGRSRKMGGTGLGLAIVKHIVNYYDGSISVQSKLGTGSVFTVSLPEILSLKTVAR